MLKTLDDVVTAVRNGALKEHLHVNVELKADWAQKYGDKLSALGNKLGGSPRWLIVGVHDDGQLAKRNEKWVKNTEEVVSQHINNLLDPNQACTGVHSVEIDGSWIVAVGVRNPGDVVYWGDDAFIAAGTTVKKMVAEDILKLRIQLPGLTDYSKQPAHARYNDDLVHKFACRVAEKGFSTEFSQAELDSGAQVLQKLEMDGRQVARILFGDATYRVVRYDNSGEPIENKRYSGLYGLLTPEFTADIQSWTQAAMGVAEPPYSDRALKEALANAVAHAAYFERDGDVIVELFPDRITLGNLCVRESAYFANRWFSRSHKTVNPLLMEVLRIGGMVDELGRGKNVIFAEALRGGKRPPEVVIERAGKHDRWKLSLFGSLEDEKLLRLLERSRSIYNDEQKALIAQALVLWRAKPVSDVRNYIDGDFSRQFAEVLAGLEGPIFYWAEQDRIILRRWAEVLIGEGKDSKAFSPGEEKSLRKLAYDLHSQYHDGYITPKDLRGLAAMSDTRAEVVLSSTMLKKWEKEGVVEHVSRGRYRFLKKAKKADTTDFLQLLELFKKEE